MVTYDSEWQNSRQKAKVIVTKKEKDSDRVLEGGVFALCAKEDIKNADGGKVLGLLHLCKYMHKIKIYVISYYQEQ